VSRTLPEDDSPQVLSMWELLGLVAEAAASKNLRSAGSVPHDIAALREQLTPTLADESLSPQLRSRISVALAFPTA
jgi:hypothetical protein